MPNSSRETKFSAANAVKEIPIFPVQLTTCRIGSLARLIHSLAICVTIHGIAFTVGFGITTVIGVLVLSVVRCFFTVVVAMKWIQEAAVRYHAQDGTP